MTEERPILGTKSVVAANLAERRRKRRLVRIVVYGAVLVIAAIAGALIVSGRTVVPVVSKQLYPIHYGTTIDHVSKKYGVDPFMVAAVVKTESGYNPQAVSPDGAVGLMQLMPDTAEWITGLRSWRGGKDPVLTDPTTSLDLGACYLGYLLETFGGYTRPALAAYNAGPGVVEEWVANAGGAESFDVDDIRFVETRDFVERVEGYWKLYLRIYPDAFVGEGI